MSWSRQLFAYLMLSFRYDVTFIYESVTWEFFLPKPFILILNVIYFWIKWTKQFSAMIKQPKTDYRNRIWQHIFILNLQFQAISWSPCKRPRKTVIRAQRWLVSSTRMKSSRPWRSLVKMWLALKSSKESPKTVVLKLGVVILLRAAKFQKKASPNFEIEKFLVY